MLIPLQLASTMEGRQRDNKHVVNEDTDDEDCPKCKGDTPPETPEGWTNEPNCYA